MALSISKLTLLVTTAATFAVAGCSTAPQQTVSVTTTVTAPPTSITTVSATPSSSASTTPNRTTATTTVGPTRQACDLLTADVAKQYVGDGAQRQFSYDGHPPVPVGDGACYYKGDTREVEVSIRPRPTDPTAPINHFQESRIAMTTSVLFQRESIRLRPYGPKRPYRTIAPGA